MSPLISLKTLIPLDHPIRIAYHKLRAVLAALVYGLPGQKMIVIGVTGTDGKTTTCNMIMSILQEAGFKTGLISTVYCSIGEEKWMNETKMTSPDPFTMNRYLSQMVKAGCKYVVMEVSSHAILYQRIWGVNFDVAVMTHISTDHLDLHRTLANYVATKKKLFSALNYLPRRPGISKVIVLNTDDTYFDEFDEIVVDKKFSYGIKRPGSIVGKNIVPTAGNTAFDLVLPNLTERINLPVTGSFNVYNALAAVAVAMSQNIPVNVVKAALEKFTGVAGRMERIMEKQPYVVIVDYAHTTDAVQKVLSTIRPVVKGRLIHVFGATGDRDKSKRPLMGKASDQFADWIILTDDDPYTENRMQILEGIKPGIKREENEGFWVIPDRRQAIKTAIYLAEPQDVILITGKGAEQVLVTNAGKIPWDDREIARGFIQERMSKT